MQALPAFSSKLFGTSRNKMLSSNRAIFVLARFGISVFLATFLTAIHSPLASHADERPDAEKPQSDFGKPKVEIVNPEKPPSRTIIQLQRPVDDVGDAIAQLQEELEDLVKDERLMLLILVSQSESFRPYAERLAEAIPPLVAGLQMSSPPLSKKEKLPAVLLDIIGLGRQATIVFKKPTTNGLELQATLRGLAVDSSGQQTVLSPLSDRLTHHRAKPYMKARRLVVVLATNATSTDDSPEGGLLEAAIKKAVAINAKVYVIGQEARFSSAAANIAIDSGGVTRDLPRSLGPDSAFREVCVYDPLQQVVTDGTWSGFGAYEHLRICRETGGAFFSLPGSHQADETMAQRGESLQRITDYAPELVSREEYKRERKSSQFRLAVWNAVEAMEPRVNPLARLRSPVVRAVPDEAETHLKSELVRIPLFIRQIDGLIGDLNAVRPLRTAEKSRRWQANFDLVHAQLLLYKIQLIDLLMALDTIPAKLRGQPKTFGLYIYHSTDVFPFDVLTARKFRLQQTEVAKWREEALYELNEVANTHVGTPWSAVAKRLIERGTSIRLGEVRYGGG